MKNGLIVDQYGTKYWYKNDLLHREDRPAIEYVDGSKFWYLHGKFHREDGPALEWADGYKEWYIHGERHREDGPAQEYADGTKYWWIHGKVLSQEDFEKMLARPKSTWWEVDDPGVTLEKAIETYLHLSTHSSMVDCIIGGMKRYEKSIAFRASKYDIEVSKQVLEALSKLNDDILIIEEKFIQSE